jgi:hypothetical protein
MGHWKAARAGSYQANMSQPQARIWFVARAGSSFEGQPREAPAD